MKYLSLISLGEIGRQHNISPEDSPHQIIFTLFNDRSEDIKTAAAFALGSITAGNINFYLPIIIEKIKSKDHTYLMFHAIKEVINRYSQSGLKEGLQIFAKEMWELLFSHCENQEEGILAVIAECIGKLTLTDPHKFLPDLQSRIRSDSARTRATVIGAIKYTFTDHSNRSDDMLKPLIVKFLGLIRDSDLNVRRLALATLNSAAHNKPYLIWNQLPQLLPLLYGETSVRNELIRVVEMGPFKHRIDDGFDARKSAYECMFTLLETSLGRIDIFGFLDHVFNGLSDHHEIKILSFMMLEKIGQVSPAALQERLDETVQLLRNSIFEKLKASAVKQEVEKSQELRRTAFKTLVQLRSLSDPGVSPKFESFVNEVKTLPDFQNYVKLSLQSEI